MNKGNARYTITAVRKDDQPDIEWQVDQDIFEEYGDFEWTYGITAGVPSSPYSRAPALVEKYGANSVYLTRIIMQPKDPRARVRQRDQKTRDLRRSNLKVLEKAGPTRRASLRERGIQKVSISRERREVWIVAIGKKEHLFFSERDARAFLKDKL